MKVISVIIVIAVVSASSVWLVDYNNSIEQNPDNHDGAPDDGFEGDTNITAKIPIDSVFDLINSSNDFTFDMYRQLIDGDDNLFFSPYSIATALGMAFEGARGETALEMANVLNFSQDSESSQSEG